IVGFATWGSPQPVVESVGLSNVVRAARYGIIRFTTNPKGVLEVLSVSLAYQFAVVVTAFAVATALGLGLSLTDMLAFVPAVAILQVVPLTIGGLGLREGAFVLFLHPLGVSTSQAVALGLLIYLVNVLVSLLGAPALALGNEVQQHEAI
ncbi:MAG: lysylphosphatidylglycerol synthase domain-containing protein, partial [Acidimicrobiales bacterium]